MTPEPDLSTADETYKQLRRLAREQGRATDELFQLYLLERFIFRWASSRHADQLVLKGGTLLAAYDLRRATRDIDVQALAVDGEVEMLTALVREICAVDVDDGVTFDLARLDARSIAKALPTKGCGYGSLPRWGGHSSCSGSTSTSAIRSRLHPRGWPIRSCSAEPSP